jgi:glycerate kinase
MGISGNTAIIEMASASGLRLLKTAELNPGLASTYGTGQLIMRALELKCTRILLGIGGSATIDGGIGLLSAMGFTFFDKDNSELQAVPASLVKVASVKPPNKLPGEIEIVILCDVNNPLLGNSGAAKVYGPQKGASSKMIELLESGMVNWCKLLSDTSGKDICNMPGMGAAGGVATGLVALLDARKVQGADYILDLLNIDDHLAWADWVITGEGLTDAQSLSLKAPVALALRARAAGKPITVITGAYQPEAGPAFDGIFSILREPLSLDRAMKNAEDLVNSVSEQIARLLLAGNADAKKNHALHGEVEKHIELNSFENAEKALALMPGDSAYFWYLKGLLLKKQQIWAEALNCFLRVVEIDPGNVKATTNIGIIRAIMGFRNPQLVDP